jgi:hypothetical protein
MKRMATHRFSTTTCALALALGAYDCSDDKKEEADESCAADDPSSCEEGFVCEQLGDDETVRSCLRPVIVEGRVFDALSGEGLLGATVVGLDANAAARTRVSVTAADGHYELPVSMRRNADGSPVEEAITLRVAAKDHQPFAVAPRTALPIELQKAVAEDDEASDDDEAPSVYRIANAATDVALIPLPEDQRGGATVSGTVTADLHAGVLVLAVSGGAAISSAVSDSDGAFTLFNVPAGSATIEGYRTGVSLEPAAVNVPAAGLSDVTLKSNDDKLSTVSGSISIVNAEGGLKTSIILALASTFDATTVRGEAPFGLRVGDISGAFSIEGVPKGRYAVLAAFENDKLVRDPDEGISGTDVVFIDVTGSGDAVSLDQGFKVTEALVVKSPGADGVELLDAGPTSLSWADDSSEDGYELRIYDALGNMVHEDIAVPRVTGSETVSYAVPDSVRFEPGMLYQFRVWSWREKGGRSYISASEDLKGVFEIKR